MLKNTFLLRQLCFAKCTSAGAERLKPLTPSLSVLAYIGWIGAGAGAGYSLLCSILVPPHPFALLHRARSLQGCRTSRT